MAQFCVFGDSIAKGVVFDAVKKKYVVAKNCCVNLFQSATGFLVKNYSRFGSTVLKGKELLLKYLPELPSYNCVVLEFGGNDCDFRWNEIAAHPDAKHRPNVDLSVFEQEYGDLIDKIKEQGAQPVLLNLPPLHVQRFFETISKDLDADAILYWLSGDPSFTYRWQEMYSLAVCRLAMEKQVPLIDIRRAFLEKIHYEAYLCEDGMHPTEQGQQLISDTLYARWMQAAGVGAAG